MSNYTLNHNRAAPAYFSLVAKIQSLAGPGSGLKCTLHCYSWKRMEQIYVELLEFSCANLDVKSFIRRNNDTSTERRRLRASVSMWWRLNDILHTQLLSFLAGRSWNICNFKRRLSFHVCMHNFNIEWGITQTLSNHPSREIYHGWKTWTEFLVFNDP